MGLRVEKPLQVRVQEAILQLIRDEKLTDGSQLPTESKLIQKLGVGRSTLREGLANLAHQGVLYKVQGKGTFVRNVPIRVENGLDVLISVTESIQAVGYTPGTSRMSVKKSRVSSSTARKLQIDEAQECFVIERVRRADDKIAAYCIDIAPTCMVPPNIKEEDFKGSLYKLFEMSGNIVSHTESALHPTILTPRDLPELTHQVGIFLLLDEIHYNTKGMPVCHSNDYYSADIFDFKIIRKRQF
jgi:GntR family transcriptional regulator